MRVVSSKSECLTSLFLDRNEPDAKHEVHIWIDGAPVMTMRFAGSNQPIPMDASEHETVNAIGLELIDPDGTEIESLWL